MDLFSSYFSPCFSPDSSEHMEYELNKPTCRPYRIPRPTVKHVAFVNGLYHVYGNTEHPRGHLVTECQHYTHSMHSEALSHSRARVLLLELPINIPTMIMNRQYNLIDRANCTVNSSWKTNQYYTFVAVQSPSSVHACSRNVNS